MASGLDTYTSQALANGTLRGTAIRKRKAKKSKTGVGPKSRTKPKYGPPKARGYGDGVD